MIIALIVFTSFSNRQVIRRFITASQQILFISRHKESPHCGWNIDVDSFSNRELGTRIIEGLLHIIFAKYIRIRRIYLGPSSVLVYFIRNLVVCSLSPAHFSRIGTAYRAEIVRYENKRGEFLPYLPEVSAEGLAFSSDGNGSLAPLPGGSSMAEPGRQERGAPGYVTTLEVTCLGGRLIAHKLRSTQWNRAKPGRSISLRAQFSATRIGCFSILLSRPGQNRVYAALPTRCGRGTGNTSTLSNLLTLTGSMASTGFGSAIASLRTSLMSAASVAQPPERIGSWFGLAPDDSPLLARDISTQEIYALEMK
jgi:hypothetical protein